MFFDISAFWHVLILLVFGHFLADYPLQGDFLAKAKSRIAPLPGVPWAQAMAAHCGIHAGIVYVVTSCWPLALLEFALHWLTDDLKVRGQLSFNADQFVHLLCKVFWAVIFVVAMGVD